MLTDCQLTTTAFEIASGAVVTLGLIGGLLWLLGVLYWSLVSLFGR